MYDHEVAKARIMKDILDRKARYLNPDPDSELGNIIMTYRIQNMINNNWLVEDNLVRSVRDKSYAGHCIICHGALEEVHFKLHCCDGRYHGKCLQDAMTVGEHAMRLKNQCIMCKQDIKTSESNLPYLFSRMPRCKDI